jgi:hypothetical protein
MVFLSVDLRKTWKEAKDGLQGARKCLREPVLIVSHLFEPFVIGTENIKYQNVDIYISRHPYVDTWPMSQCCIVLGNMFCSCESLFLHIGCTPLNEAVMVSFKAMSLICLDNVG